MPPTEPITRRELIKLMVLLSAAVRPAPCLLAEAVFNPSPDGTNGAHPPPPHPRLFYRTAALERLRQMLASDPAAHAALKQQGDQLLAADFVPEEQAMRGIGQHANYGLPARQMSEMGLTLGVLYHLTGDARYAGKLRDALLYYAKYARWTGQSFFGRTPPWHSELDTAAFGFGFATGYDALHGVLAAADRTAVAEAMVRLAVLPILNDWVLPGRRIHSLDSMGHNWWGVCVAGAGLGALALLGEDPRAQEWIEAIDAGFAQWFSYSGNVPQNRVATFQRSGPSYESVTYNNYGVSEYLHYRLAWQNTYPRRQPVHLEPLEHIARYFLHTLYPTATGFYAVNFNDSSLETDSTATLLLLIACGLGTPEAGRFLELVHTHPQSALFSLLRQYPAPASAANVPTSCAYPQMGWAMMRSSWANDATLLAVKSGYTWNHAHADAGTFMLFKQGLPLIIDSGTCSYNRPEYSSYYRQSRAHNVILFDGAGQPKDDILLGCKFPGRLHSLIDGLGLKYVYADATGPMARWFLRNYRHWLWSGDVILIFDDVRAYTAGRMDWLLHYDGEYTTDSNGGVRLKNGAAEAVVKMLYPQSKLREDIGLADHNPDKKVPYLVFSAGTPAASRQFITVICLNPDAVPKFEVLEGRTYLGVRMLTPDALEEFYLDIRAVDSPGTIRMQIGNWATDAYLLHLKRAAAGNQSVRRFFMADGSYLRQQDRSEIESLSKVTACWAPGDSLEVYSDGASDSIQIAAEHPPHTVNWNGRPVPIRYDRRSKLTLLHG
ncbi:MAG: heparinase II/III family protein [Verrucomicrobia bacterium]|nr:heparinase II/III family protein [Verrucomicrobiota bacterium]